MSDESLMVISARISDAYFDGTLTRERFLNDLRKYISAGASPDAVETISQYGRDEWLKDL